MNKDYFITLGIGIMVLLAVTLIASETKGNRITGLVDATPATTTPPPTAQPQAADLSSLLPTTGSRQGSYAQNAKVLFTFNNQPVNGVDPAGVIARLGTPARYDQRNNLMTFSNSEVWQMQGGTWNQIQNNQITQKVESISNTGGTEVTQYKDGKPSTVTFYQGAGQTNRIGKESYPAQFASQLHMRPEQNKQPAEILYNGYKAEIVKDSKENPIGIVTYDDQNNVNNAIVQEGNGYAIIQDGKVTFSPDGNPNNAIPRMPTLKDAHFDPSINAITGSNGEVTVNDQGRLTVAERGEATETDYVREEDGTIITEYTLTSSEHGPRLLGGQTLPTRTVTSQSKVYDNGDTGQSVLDANGETQYIKRYNRNFILTRIEIGTGATRQVLSISQDRNSIFDCNGCTPVQQVIGGRPQFNKDGSPVWVDGDPETGKVLSPLTASELEKRAPGAADAVRKNNFWIGQSGTAQFLSDVQKTTQAFGFLHLWLDRYDGINRWKSQVDAVFARYVPSTQAAITNICGVWTDLSNAPSNIALDDHGNEFGHIEGHQIVAAIDENGTVKTAYIYKITLAVSKYILVNPDEYFNFNIQVEQGGNAYPVLLTQGVAGTDKLVIGKNITDIRVDGNQMIVRMSSQLYDRVCLNFGSSSALKGSFRQHLRDGKMCDIFGIDKNQELPPFATGGGLQSFLTGILGDYFKGGGGNKAGAPSGGGGQQQPSNPTITNSINATAGGGGL